MANALIPHIICRPSPDVYSLLISKKQHKIMANWMTSKAISARYGVDEEKVLSWQELKEISYSYIGNTLLIDTDSVDAYLKDNQTLADKQAIRESLILREEWIIESTLKQYDGAEFVIHLQSKCFGLYPYVVQALATMLDPGRSRQIFCAIANGHPIERIAAAHHMSKEEVIRKFEASVYLLRQVVKKLVNSQREAYSRLEKRYESHEEELKKEKEKSRQILCKYLDLRGMVSRQNRRGGPVVDMSLHSQGEGLATNLVKKNNPHVGHEHQPIPGVVQEAMPHPDSSEADNRKKNFWQILRSILTRQ